jgi:c-di-AMP phosphodiesterase-like protein
MPLAIVKRYLLPYLLTTFLAFSLWVSIDIAVDGWLPVLAFVLLLAAMLMTMPVLAYLDYHDVKAMVIEIIEVKKGNKTMSKAEVTQKTIGMISEKIALPEFLVSFFANKAIEKYESRSKTQLTQEV